MLNTYEIICSQFWEKTYGVDIREAVGRTSYNPGHLADQLVSSSTPVKKIGFIGLGAMGFGMATHLLKSNFSVIAYDVKIFDPYVLHQILSLSNLC
jgi:phosphoglycerate dehydrogenase-like enzyme